MPDTDNLLETARRHHAAGRLAEAEPIYRQILDQNPGQLDALHLLGMIAVQLNRPGEGLPLLVRAVAACPDQAVYRNTLAAALAALGRASEAVVEFRTVVRLNPNSAQARWNLASGLRDSGALDESIAEFRQVVRLQPDFPGGCNNLGVLLCMRGSIDEGLEMFRRAIQLGPDAAAYTNLGRALFEKGQIPEAIAAYRKSIELQGQNFESHANLGNALRAAGLLDDAIAAHREAIRLAPGRGENYLNLANVLRDQGSVDEAIAAYRRAVELNPHSPGTHSSLLLARCYDPASTAETLRHEAAEWNRRHAEPLKNLIPAHANDRSPDRRLRVGFISPDFREHPVGRFIRPLLANHDARQVEIVCYSDATARDDLTREIKGRAHLWRDVAGIPDAAVADLIFRDRIDILIDLASHTANNRLLVFARKPAPVQATWLAYPGTTGLAAIDFRITDPFIDPPGENDASYTERSLRLPSTYWCYEAPTDVPVGPLPAISNGEITFGCLNNFSKITPPALECWSELLRAVPNSRMILHAGQGSHRERLCNALKERGVSANRIEFVAKAPMAAYLEQFRRIDIGLDPFPFAGGTTTCDSLWMGVPVVTLRGSTAVGRLGVSILNDVGLPELIAGSAADYVHRASELAGDLSRLARLRSTLRQQMADSPLMNAPAFARAMESLYRQMWQTWCLR